MKPGQVMCLKTTGELCIVIGRSPEVEAVNGSVYITRRPVMTHENGISHSLDTFQGFELETVEEHLRHEAKEMLLKTQIQEEMMAEMDNAKKSKIEKMLVN